MMKQEILELIKPLLASSPIAVVAYILHISGVLRALANKLKGNSDNGKIRELEKFREDIENNHLHEIERLRKKIDALDEKVDAMNIRLVKVEVKVNGK